LGEQRFDSTRWTGGLRYNQPRLSPGEARARLRWAAPLIVIMAFWLLYTLVWHSLWKFSGSPPVYPVTNMSDLIVPLGAGVAGYAMGRWWRKWPLMCGVVTGSIAMAVYLSTAFLLDLHSPIASGEHRAFVDSAFEPRYPPSRHMRLEHELRLSVFEKMPRRATVPEVLYRDVVPGDTCIQIRWKGGRRYRFFDVVRHLPIGDGNGSWLNAPKDRANCLWRP